MTDWSTTDARLGRDAYPPDEPTPDDRGDRVAVAPDGGAGGWEAFDDPDALAPPATVDEPKPHTAADAQPPDGGAGGWEAFDDPTPIADEPKQVEALGDTERVSAIVEPGGRPIGEVGKAEDPRIRELPGGLTAAQELFHALSEGGVDVTPAGHPGKLVELPDGGHVGFRPRTRSHSPAIDLDVPGVRVRKIHFE